MQISGHKNVASINNYSPMTEERHKGISNNLSNTESTHRNALVPCTVARNLPRTKNKTVDIQCSAHDTFLE